MATSSENNNIVHSRGPLILSKKKKMAVIYFIGLFIPYAISRTVNMDNKGIYASILSIINLLAMMAFFVQFPLASRLKQIPFFANIDWNISTHKKVGQWLSVIFLSHPILILAPRFFVSFDDAFVSIVDTVTSPKMLTGVIAWCLMIVWILTSIFKNRLPVRYETWRLSHVVGFVVIAIIATLHITNIGSHGQFQSQFNFVWWVLCSLSVLMVGYNYFVKPTHLKKNPFTLTHVTKISSSDWLVTLVNKNRNDFNFEVGQFVWLNTSGSTKGVNEHPFSIASCKKDLPSLSFIIRELGDYTSTLGALKEGQDVYVDGPYGSLSLKDSEGTHGITLIAGGAGIAPMLSLLRELAYKHDSRPVRLIYGNNKLDQMVCQQEIQQLESEMVNFRQQLVCIEKTDLSDVHTGVIDRVCLENSINPNQKGNWAIYSCGPAPMIRAVNEHAKVLRIHSDQIHYEQLAF
ncbi:ferric reductase-like transmembrane domain-containing protein [Vibrio sp. F74]|uniref:ferredoxin reductase family protein n=1 Tax=Vibrio sp. F74 TaxID=700020 RepID=UPI0035F5EC4F